MSNKQVSKKFVPCYKVVITYDLISYRKIVSSCYFDYFLKNLKGQSIFDYIQDWFAVPFYYTRVDIFRCLD